MTAFQNRSMSHVATRPTTWQKRLGTKRRIDRAVQELLEPRRLLSVTPDLLWTQYVGGAGEDGGYDIAVDPVDGSVVMGGGTRAGGWINDSTDPSPGYNGSAWDGFVVRFDASGNPSSQPVGRYVGGGGEDIVESVFVDQQQRIYAAGWQSGSGFVVQYDRHFTQLWSASVGGSHYATQVQASASGDVFVTGYTYPSGQIFANKYTSNGTLLWSQYYGQGGRETSWRSTLAPSGELIITGYTQSPGWLPHVGGGSGGGSDGFVIRVDPATGTQLSGVSMGGSGEDYGVDVAADASGIYVIGVAFGSTGWADGAGTTYGGGVTDDFVMKFDHSLTPLWSRYAGGPSLEGMPGFGFEQRITVSPTGEVIILSSTKDVSWLPNPRETFNARTDRFSAYMMALSPANGSSEWSAIIGGSRDDYGNMGVGFSPDGQEMWVAGSTGWSGSQTDWGTSPGSDDLILRRNSYQGGAGDTFLAKLRIACPPPTAEILASDPTPDEGQLILLDASRSAPGDGCTITSYLWDVDGDGFDDGSGSIVSHAFDDNGEYTVRVRVTQCDGQSADASQTIVVANVAPTPTITGVPGVPPEARLPICLGSVVTDPSVADTSAGFSYYWTVYRNGVKVDPLPVDNTGPAFCFTPPKSGHYEFRLTVRDKDDHPAGSDSAMVVVVPAAACVVSGSVWLDLNNDGQIDFGENGIGAVQVRLTGVDDLGNPVDRFLVRTRFKT